MNIQVGAICRAGMWGEESSSDLSGSHHCPPQRLHLFTSLFMEASAHRPDGLLTPLPALLQRTWGGAENSKLLVTTLSFQ